jgi:hypothetical protein
MFLKFMKHQQESFTAIRLSAVKICPVTNKKALDMDLRMGTTFCRLLLSVLRQNIYIYIYIY